MKKRRKAKKRGKIMLISLILLMALAVILAEPIKKQITKTLYKKEYSEYVTKTDADFFSLSREAKCINIVSTQSYSSLKNTGCPFGAVPDICGKPLEKFRFMADHQNTALVGTEGAL